MLPGFYLLKDCHCERSAAISP